MIRVYLKTSRGMDKTASEDRVLVGKNIYVETDAVVDLDEGCVAVADGVGGNQAGDVAAEQVCLAVSESEKLDEARFSAINGNLIEKSRGCDAYRDMATTLSGFYCSTSGNLSLFHVGNTRIYSIQAKRYLMQLTEDDTVVEYLLKTGKLTEDEVLSYPRRNEITACFGGGKESLLTIKLSNMAQKDFSHLLITSDGVHEYLTVDDMEDLIDDARGDWVQAIEALVSEAKKRGSVDDCSAVIVERRLMEDSDGLEI